MDRLALAKTLAVALVAGCGGADGGSLLSASPVADNGDAAINGVQANPEGGSVDSALGSDTPAAGDAAVPSDTRVPSDDAAVRQSADRADVAYPDATLGATGEAGEAGDEWQSDTSGIAPLPSLHVVGNGIFDNDTPVVLTGVHRAGTEYSCVNGTGIFDGPSDVTSVQGIKSWTPANAVRIPLNEDCWLAINGVAPQYAGANYQNAITQYVTLLLENGLYPILDLHWSAAGAQLATGQAVMPDQDHSPTFWSQVAGAFKDNLGVVFELFNEPNPAGGQETSDAWSCWRDGSDASGDAGSCTGTGYAAAGMQTLLSAVRSAGANNLVLLGGVVAANALSQWSVYVPTDPANNVAAAWHAYSDRPCSTTSCFDAKVDPVAQAYPIVATELGERDCQGTFVTTVTDWLDSRQQSYLGFTWNAWGDCQSLISDYSGTPTLTYGMTYKAHLQALAAPGGG